MRYLYELDVPLGGWLLFVAWLAANADVALGGGLDRPAVGRRPLVAEAGDLTSLPARARNVGRGGALPDLTRDEVDVLWRLCTGALSLGAVAPGPRCFVPLVATRSMRMQSSFHRKWSMHEEAR